MFDYLETLTSSWDANKITKDTGISRSQLIKLTQHDDWEDANHDFFGTLNRVFSELDGDDNGILSSEGKGVFKMV